MIKTAFGGRMVMVGFGSVGRGSLELIRRHIEIPAGRITIVTADRHAEHLAELLGIKILFAKLDLSNYLNVLRPLVGEGDFLVNLSWGVSSVALLGFCQLARAHYLDTSIEPWQRNDLESDVDPLVSSNYVLREQALALQTPRGPTAILAHGANPGLVSHFVKEALGYLAKELAQEYDLPTTRQGWGRLAHSLGVRVIHITERDTQKASYAKQAVEFANTWSAEGLAAEASAFAELGWGTHEHELPTGGARFGYGCDAAIYLAAPGGVMEVRSWMPPSGEFEGRLVTHNESISIADYYTQLEDGQVLYRPTVHYVYQPCHDAQQSIDEMAANHWTLHPRRRVLMEEIRDGFDELGVLVMCESGRSYSISSQLSIDAARQLAPYNNATSLQVAAGVLSGAVWLIENPDRGVLEANDLDHRRVLEIARPYLGEVISLPTNWTPDSGSHSLQFDVFSVARVNNR